MDHQSDNARHNERAKKDDSFEIFKPKLLMAIDKIKEIKPVDMDAIHNFIVQTDATHIDKNTIKDFVTPIVAQKLVIKKNTSQGNESYHKTSSEEDLPQPPRHSTRTLTKENFNERSEGESRPRQTSFITTSTLRMTFLKLLARIIWVIKGMLMTFLTN